MRFTGILFSLLVIACRTDTANISGSHDVVPLNEGFVMAVGETVLVDGANLALSFRRVASDSRCPSDVQCIWAGNAELEFVARSRQGNTTFKLNTTEGAKEYAINSYRIELVGLNPAPVSGQPIPAESYRAQLRVSRSGVVCALYAAAAINVVIRDSVTGAVPSLTGVSVVARTGDFADSVKLDTYPPPYSESIGLAYERKGTYTVTVRANGYEPWVRSGIVVTADECHVIPASLTARIRR